MKRVGETAWLIPLPSSERVGAVSTRVRATEVERVRDVVPGARSVLVVFRDPPGEADRAWLAGIAAEGCLDARAVAPGVAAAQRWHDVPVRYDGDDLEVVARRAGLSVDQTIALHASATYRVAFVGFQPGFAYLDGLPDRLWTPRRASPRTRVPRGAVAIGGEWTGIYPSESPGGWHLIGHTDLDLFNPHAARPALFEPGDLVRMVPR